MFVMLASLNSPSAPDPVSRTGSSRQLRKCEKTIYRKTDGWSHNIHLVSCYSPLCIKNARRYCVDRKCIAIVLAKYEISTAVDVNEPTVIWFVL